MSGVDASGRALNERDWLVTLRRSDGSLVYLIFISPDKEFNRFLPTFNEMLRSFRLR